MKSSKYWQERFTQLEDATNKDAMMGYRDVAQAYQKAQAEIEAKINTWYQRFADNNSITMTEARKLLTVGELEEFKWSVEEYIKHGKDNAISGQWAKELENASARYHISRLEALKIQTQQSIEALYGNQLDTVDKAIKDMYSSRYYRTAFELQKGFGVGVVMDRLDNATLNNIVNKPWAVDGANFSSRIWSNKQKLVNELHSSLTRNIITGADPAKAIKEIKSKMGTSSYAAGRLIMTESAYFGSVAQKNVFSDLGVEKYEIIATLDSKTSEICRKLDGKVFDMKDFQAGVTAPPFNPYCRTTTSPHFDDWEELGIDRERVARNDKGEKYFVDGNMTYKEWEKQYVNRDIDFNKFDITEGGSYLRINSNRDLDVYLKRIEHEFSTQRLTVKESKHLWDKTVGYIQSQGYADINEYMRGLKPNLDNPKRRFTVNILKRLTNNNSLVNNYIGVRKVDAGYLKNVLGIDTKGLLKMGTRKDGMGRLRTQLLPRDKQTAQKISDAINALVGTSKGSIVDKAFTSVSLDESLNYFSHYPIKFEIQMKKGTKGLITSNLQESEFIIKDGSSIEIIGSKVYNDNGDNCILVFAKIKQ